MELGGYEPEAPEDEPPAPDFPDHPTPQEVVNIAFRRKVVMNIDHPALASRGGNS